VAGVEPVDANLRLLQVSGEDRRAQPELGVVGPLQGLVEVLDPSDRQQRTEGLLPPDPRFQRDVGDDRGFDEERNVEWLTSQPLAGSRPPSSSVTCFRSDAASAITCLPVWVSPVKPILRTFGFLISSWPTTAPGPTTTLSTPGGRPPSFISSTRRMVDRGVVLAGLATTVFPTARAGAILFASRVSGKFHAIMAPTTPSGRRPTSR